MPILELCAGYGGLGMAVEELTGDKVAYVAEVDEAASKILSVRYPDAPNIGDITQYDWTQLVGLVQDWTDYEPAIRRQEFITDRQAPIPTELGPRGGRRLTARFAEWLMGLPDGWVTDAPDLVPPKRDPRSKQLKAIGNGVVPQQAYAAFSHLLSQVALMKEVASSDS